MHELTRQTWGSLGRPPKELFKYHDLADQWKTLAKKADLCQKRKMSNKKLFQMKDIAADRLNIIKLVKERERGHKQD